MHAVTAPLCRLVRHKPGRLSGTGCDFIRQVVVLLVLACAGLAGCGTTSTATAGPKSRTVTIVSTAVATAAPATPTLGPTPTASQACRTSELALAVERNGVALGHVGIILRIDNRGQRTCALDGYPTLQLLDANQQPLPTHQQQTTLAYTFSLAAPQPVVLASGASAYFHLEWTDFGSSGQSCAYNAAYLRVTPPQNETPLLLQLAVTACDGNIITSPLEPTSAY